MAQRLEHKRRRFLSKYRGGNSSPNVSAFMFRGLRGGRYGFVRSSIVGPSDVAHHINLTVSGQAHVAIHHNSAIGGVLAGQSFDYGRGGDACGPEEGPAWD